MSRWPPGGELRRLTVLYGLHRVPLLLGIRHGDYLDGMSTIVEPGVCGSTGVMDP
jgi:hypothetical protein